MGFSCSRPVNLAEKLAQFTEDLQGAPEVDAGPFQPLAFVEAMSVCALLTRIEVKLTDALGPPEFGKPREKGGSVSAGTSLRKRDEIIDVEVAPPRETFAKAETGYRYWIATIAQRRKSVARDLL